MQLPVDKQLIADTGVIGVGNTLMGDDGAGIIAVEKLCARLGNRNDLFFLLLQRDLFEMADYLNRAKRFIFIDVFIGSPAGRMEVFYDQQAIAQPSLHQTGVGTVMRMLRPLGLVETFPGWEIRGIAVEPPLLLGTSLSPQVSRAVDALVDELHAALTV